MTNPTPAAKSAQVAGEPRAVAIVALQLFLVLGVVYQFQLESRTFFNVMLLAAVGFVIHALLPLRFRLAFFCALSMASVVVAFGVLDGIFLLGLGVVLIGLCHLPLPMRYRLLVLLFTGTLFAAWRMELLPAPWSVAIWPILASMFMFRLALYLYALEHDRQAPTVQRTLAYFFMLPNVCFPLYPVVDYTTFGRNYFDRDANRIYETGIKWIVRGLVHLILYRFVYLYLAGDPAELQDLGDLTQFVLATFLLYLRVSGQFHLIIGVLHLFGFRLPDTHHLYYLASSFTDFWRRINIYWKDFMMKLVYYPSYFRLRRHGNNFALVAATGVVFLSTWLLHSYQWFWLRGGFPLEPQDGLFWGLLAVLVAIGALREMNSPRQRAPAGKPRWSLGLALRTLRTFVAICVLWSLWSADSVVAWLLMWPAALNADAADILLLLGLAVAFMAVAGYPWKAWETYEAPPRALHRRPELRTTATLLVILLLGSTALYQGVSPTVAATLVSLQGSTLNARDAGLKHKGYYENLDNDSRMSAQLWNVQEQKPASWVGLSQTPAYRSRDEFRNAELVPNAAITFLDQPLTTNQWGMRDRERSLEKPSGTVRIAVLGPSHVMGSGVADGDTFTAILEDRLNESVREGSGVRYEVLNFGVAGLSLVTQLAMLHEQALRFQPDVVIVTDSPRGDARAIGHLLEVVSAGRPIPFEGLQALVDRSGIMALRGDGVPVPFESARALFGAVGIETRMPWTEAERRVRRISDDLLRWTLGDVATTARAHGAVPVYLALDNVVEAPAETVPVLQHARDAGLLVMDLLDIWRGTDMPALRIAPWDDHPNAAGNRVIAERIFELMQQHQEQLPLRGLSL